MQPGEQVGWRQFGNPFVVAGDLRVAEDLAARAGPAPAEEGRVALEHPGRRDQPVGVAPHALEAGRPDEGRPGRPRHIEAEPSGHPPHLPLEVGGQLVVVHEQHVGRRTPGPGVGQVPEQAGQRVQVVPRVLAGHPGSRVAVDVGHQPVVQRLARPRRPGRRGRPGQRGDPGPVQVVALVVEGHRGVQRVPAGDDVPGPRVERDPVQRGVRLDEPPVPLRGQYGQHLLARRDQVVQPGGQLAERGRQLRGPEDQQGADHLHPGRPGLGPGADHYVAVAELHARPAGAVLLVVDVPVQVGHQSRVTRSGQAFRPRRRRWGRPGPG